MTKRKIFHVALALLLSVPYFVSAANCPGICPPYNPQYSTIPKFIQGVLEAVVKISLPIVGFFVLYAGFKFVSAGGNSSKLDDAKENFKYVIIGTILILGAWVIARLIGNTVGEITGNDISL